MSSSSNQTGAWTPYACIDNEQRSVFEAALAGRTGVAYEPVAVATQVVAGTNYSFFANAQIVYPGAANRTVFVDVFRDLNGDIHLTGIHEIRSTYQVASLPIERIAAR